MTEEALASNVLEHDVGNQRGYEDGHYGHSGPGGLREQPADEIYAEVAEGDPHSRPEERAGRRVEEKSLQADADHPRKSAGQRVQSRKELGQDQIPDAMQEETLLGVPDERIGIQGEAAHDPERAVSQ